MRSLLFPARAPSNSPTQSLSRVPPELTRRPRTRWVAEVLGPAGAGKTTVVRALKKQIAIRDEFLASWPDKLRVLGSITRELMPAYMREWTGSRGFNLEEFRRLLRVMTLHRALKQASFTDGTIAIIDHGPICMLGMVQAFGPMFVSSRQFARWWDAAINLWSGTLDMVLWLDAPDTTLVQRINLRKDRHVLKGKSFQQASMFLQRCRLSYELILSEMKVRGGPVVLRFDTGNVSTDDIVNQLLHVLATEPGFWGTTEN